jgi:hypothetical protein
VLEGYACGRVQLDVSLVSLAVAQHLTVHPELPGYSRESVPTRTHWEYSLVPISLAGSAATSAWAQRGKLQQCFDHPYQLSRFVIMNRFEASSSNRRRAQSTATLVQ